MTGSKLQGLDKMNNNCCGNISGVSVKGGLDLIVNIICCPCSGTGNFTHKKDKVTQNLTHEMKKKTFINVTNST